MAHSSYLSHGTSAYAIGLKVEERPDAIAIPGSAGTPLPGGAVIASRLDHRIAMSFAIAGLRSAKPVTIDDMSPVATSYPHFAATLRELQSA